MTLTISFEWYAGQSQSDAQEATRNFDRPLEKAFTRDPDPSPIFYRNGDARHSSWGAGIMACLATALKAMAKAECQAGVAREMVD